MHIKLKVLRGASAGKEIGIKAPKFIIGRADECNLRVNSEAISRQHCLISFDGEEVRIRDLGSRNGTLVNGERLEAPRRLLMGDQLRVGPLEFLVTYAHASAPATGAVPKGRSPVSSEQDVAGLISDWLTEADETDQRGKAVDTETRAFRVDETGRIPLPTTSRDATPNVSAGTPQTVDPQTVDPQTAEAGSATSGAPAASKGDRQLEGSEGTDAGAGGGDASATAAFGKKVPPKNAPPKDTQEAAAQTLRKLLNRGGN